MPNGDGDVKKPSWLTYLTALGIVVILFINLTGIGNKIISRNTGSALQAQNVLDNTEDITELETEVDTVNKNYNILKNDFVVVKNDVGHIMTEQVEIKGKVTKLVENDIEILKLLNEIKNK